MPARALLPSLIRSPANTSVPAGLEMRGRLNIEHRTSNVEVKRLESRFFFFTSMFHVPPGLGPRVCNSPDNGGSMPGERDTLGRGFRFSLAPHWLASCKLALPAPSAPGSAAEGGMADSDSPWPMGGQWVAAHLKVETDPFYFVRLRGLTPECVPELYK